jgi:hypothetical protein
VTEGLIDIAFDWVSGTNAGAFAPGEEVAVIGKSLIPDYGPPPPTCPVPFADVDEDGDVDQIDFGVFQVCYAGSGIPHGTNPICGCLDVNLDQDIDVEDFEAFSACATGPSVPFDPENPPANCVP